MSSSAQMSNQVGLQQELNEPMLLARPYAPHDFVDACMADVDDEVAAYSCPLPMYDPYDRDSFESGRKGAYEASNFERAWDRPIEPTWTPKKVVRQDAETPRKRHRTVQNAPDPAFMARATAEWVSAASSSLPANPQQARPAPSSPVSSSTTSDGPSVPAQKTPPVVPSASAASVLTSPTACVTTTTMSRPSSDAIATVSTAPAPTPTAAAVAKTTKTSAQTSSDTTAAQMSTAAVQDITTADSRPSSDTKTPVSTTSTSDSKSAAVAKTTEASSQTSSDTTAAPMSTAAVQKTTTASSQTSSSAAPMSTTAVRDTTTADSRHSSDTKTPVSTTSTSDSKSAAVAKTTKASSQTSADTTAAPMSTAAVQKATTTDVKAPMGTSTVPASVAPTPSAPTTTVSSSTVPASLAPAPSAPTVTVHSSTVPASVAPTPSAPTATVSSSTVPASVAPKRSQSSNQTDQMDDITATLTQVVTPPQPAVPTSSASMPAAQPSVQPKATDSIDVMDIEKSTPSVSSFSDPVVVDHKDATMDLDTSDNEAMDTEASDALKTADEHVENTNDVMTDALPVTITNNSDRVEGLSGHDNSSTANSMLTAQPSSAATGGVIVDDAMEEDSSPESGVVDDGMHQPQIDDDDEDMDKEQDTHDTTCNSSTDLQTQAVRSNQAQTGNPPQSGSSKDKQDQDTTTTTTTQTYSGVDPFLGIWFLTPWDLTYPLDVQGLRGNYEGETWVQPLPHINARGYVFHVEEIYYPKLASAYKNAVSTGKFVTWDREDHYPVYKDDEDRQFVYLPMCQKAEVVQVALPTPSDHLKQDPTISSPTEEEMNWDGRDANGEVVDFLKKFEEEEEKRLKPVREAEEACMKFIKDMQTSEELSDALGSLSGIKLKNLDPAEDIKAATKAEKDQAARATDLLSLSDIWTKGEPMIDALLAEEIVRGQAPAVQQIAALFAPAETILKRLNPKLRPFEFKKSGWNLDKFVTLWHHIIDVIKAVYDDDNNNDDIANQSYSDEESSMKAIGMLLPGGDDVDFWDFDSTDKPTIVQQARIQSAKKRTAAKRIGQMAASLSLGSTERQKQIIQLEDAWIEVKGFIDQLKANNRILLDLQLVNKLRKEHLRPTKALLDIFVKGEEPLTGREIENAGWKGLWELLTIIGTFDDDIVAVFLQGPEWLRYTHVLRGLWLDVGALNSALKAAVARQQSADNNDEEPL